MHPNKAFQWTDREAMLRFADEVAFAHIFTASVAGMFVAHAPVMVTSAGKLQFHLARGNRLAGQFEGRSILISVSGREGFHSGNWYVSANQVPTWHYEAVEIEGLARKLTDEELVNLLDRLSERQEGKHSPERPWTRSKMQPGKFESMTKAIIGVEVDAAEVRGTRKFNQHKSAEDLAATIEGQRGAGREDIVAAIVELTGRE